jgi:hypothetical protein
MADEFDFDSHDLRAIAGGSLAEDPDAALIEKYSKDFSTDFAYGQLSVVQILEETINELISDIPELNILPKERKDQIEKQILIFSLTCFDQGRNP